MGCDICQLCHSPVQKLSINHVSRFNKCAFPVRPSMFNVVFSLTPSSTSERHYPSDTTFPNSVNAHTYQHASGCKVLCSITSVSNKRQECTIEPLCHHLYKFAVDVIIRSIQIQHKDIQRTWEFVILPWRSNTTALQVSTGCTCRRGRP